MGCGIGSRRVSVLAVGVAFSLLAMGLTSLDARADATFVGLGDLPGGTVFSQAYGVSADGSVVVGYSHQGSGNEAFRWTAAGGMVGIGELTGGTFFSHAWATSSDGAMVVGVSGGSSASSEAFRWTASGGGSGGSMTSLGDLAGGSFYSYAYDTSADGGTVVGFSRSGSGKEAFRWTAAGGMEGLGDLAGGGFESQALSISADGTVVAGFSVSSLGVEAFRWTDSGGMTGLGDLGGGSFFSFGYDTSADGSVIVGRSSSGNGIEAFRWTDAGGMEGLGDLAGGNFESWAFGVSGDGSIVVGKSKTGTTSSSDRAFIWDATNGMRNLKTVLVDDYGLDLTNWQLREAWAISTDGSTIVGYGINPQGNSEAFAATISMPEPGSFLLMVFLSASALTLQRRRR